MSLPQRAMGFIRDEKRLSFCEIRNNDTPPLILKLIFHKQPSCPKNISYIEHDTEH